MIVELHRLASYLPSTFIAFCHPYCVFFILLEQKEHLINESLKQLLEKNAWFKDMIIP